MIHNKWAELNQKINNCEKCPRLVAWRDSVSKRKRKAYLDLEYWGKPVPGFGDQNARVLIVGLAPGAHGSNRTGRMFTGDSAGNFLFRALYKADFCNQPHSINRDDGLILSDLFITALCRCVPPDNRPSNDEIMNCQLFLTQEVSLLKNLEGIVCLGRLAFDHIKKLLLINEKSQANAYEFKHNAFYSLENNFPWLITSYHPSQQNTQTGRLTEAMFDSVWFQVRQMLTKNQSHPS